MEYWSAGVLGFGTLIIHHSNFHRIRRYFYLLSKSSLIRRTMSGG